MQDLFLFASDKNGQHHSHLLFLTRVNHVHLSLAKELVVFCLPSKKGELDKVNIGDAYPFFSHQTPPHEEGLGQGPGMLGCADSEQRLTSGWPLVGLPILPPPHTHTHCTYCRPSIERGVRGWQGSQQCPIPFMWSVPTSGASSRRRWVVTYSTRFVKATNTISSTCVSGNKCFFVCLFVCFLQLLFPGRLQNRVDLTFCQKPWKGF